LAKNISSFLKSNAPFAVIIKQENEDKVSDIVVAPDLELKKVLNANKIYTFVLTIFVEAQNSTPDLNSTIDFDGTSDEGGFGETGGTPSNHIAFGTEAVEGASTTSVALVFFGDIRTTSKGTLSFNWAQNVSNAGFTRIQLGSSIIIYES